MPNPAEKKDIKNLTHKQLQTWLEEHKIRSFRSIQILKWIYQRQAEHFNEMTDVRKQLQKLLAEHFYIGRLQKIKEETSSDGSRKFLFELQDKNRIETVLIQERNYYTLCISSQVGCAQGCLFCLTARDGFIRNLTANEIICQVRDIQKNMTGSQKLRNLVFMGMGEPLANFSNISQAIDVITNMPWGLKFSNRRITVSTAGLVSKMDELGQAHDVNLAVSLNAVDNSTRTRLMPINRKYPIETLLEACLRYPLSTRRKITFEYILIKGINDSQAEAEHLAFLLRPLKAKINLIPYNEHQASDFTRPSEAVIEAFRDTLIQKGFILRTPRGRMLSVRAFEYLGIPKPASFNMPVLPFGMDEDG